MDPITILSLATGITKMFGLDEKLGRMINGEKGAEVARKVTDVASVMTGGQSPQEVLDILQQDKQMRQQLYLKLIEIQEGEAQREMADRADARDMQKVALGQDDKFSKRYVYYLATGWSVFTMSYIGLITFAPIPQSSQRFADTILGFLLGTIVATIINYFFGSTKGSKDKDSSMSALIEAIKEKRP